MHHIVAGTIRIDPSQTTAALETAVEMAQRSRQEPGNIEYVISVDPEDDGLLRVFECYESADAVEAHMGSEHMATFRRAMAGWGVTEVNLTRYEVAAAGPLGRRRDISSPSPGAA